MDRAAARELHAKLKLAMSMDDAKEVLGFPPNSFPSPDEVAKAYKKKVRENHPDRGGDLQKMVEINVAKEVLDGKSRADFTKQRDEAERKRREELKRDVAAIEAARDKAFRAMSMLSIRAFELQGREPLRPFLLDDFADALDLVHDHAEKSLKAPASKLDEKALRQILATIKEMNGLALRAASKVKGITAWDASNIRLSQLESVYAAAHMTIVMLQDILALSKQLNGLLTTGFPPSYDEGVSIPEIVANRYFSEGHRKLESYIHDLSSFNPGEPGKVLATIEAAVTLTLDILQTRRVDLDSFDLSSNWMSWDIPESFDLAVVGIQFEPRTAGMVHRVASRYKVA